MAALAKGNASRTAGAEIKRAVRDGLPLSEALEDDRAKAVLVFNLIKARHRFGDAHANKILATCRISPTKRVRDLTERQHDALMAEFRTSEPKERAA